MTTRRPSNFTRSGPPDTEPSHFDGRLKPAGSPAKGSSAEVSGGRSSFICTARAGRGWLNA